jgi:hypothetical protein
MAEKKGWEITLKKEKIDDIGIHLIMGANKKFMEDYNICSARFILIDPEGKIVEADTPKPSDPKLIKLFNEQDL